METTKISRGTSGLVSVAVFLVIVVTHVASPMTNPTDTIWVLPTAVSILRKGTPDLSAYHPPRNDYRIEWVGAKAYQVFPIGVPLIAAPFVFFIDKTIPVAKWELLLYYNFRVMKIIASIIIAVASVFVFLIASTYVSPMRSILAVFVFAFCTPVWSTASRALYQHGPSILMLTITLFLMIRAERNPRLIQFSGIPLFASFLMRPTNVISCLILTAFVAVHYTKFLSRYLCWAGIIVGLFVAYSLTTHGSILPPYYLPSRIGSMDRLGEALIGNIVSPSRGLFVFCPILLFSIAGMALKMRHPHSDKLEYYVLGILLLHWVSISSFPHWWGGWSIGPRFFADMIPYFIYFFVFFLAAIPNSSKLAFWHYSVLAAMLALCAISFSINYRGAVDKSVYLWNGVPNNIDLHPERLWDWSDPQFLRGLHLF